MLNNALSFQTKFISTVVLCGMAAIVGSALAFEHIGGFAPCALCLEQRTPYYIGIGVLGAAIIATFIEAPAMILKAGLAIAFACLLATAAMGVYHAGVEWSFWAGPESCSAGMTGEGAGAGGLLDSLATSKPPACDEAAGRFLGLSFAGWNVLAALALAAITWRGLRSPAK